jgi:hypothetical protein
LTPSRGQLGQYLAHDHLHRGDIQEVVLVARITGIIAALAWFVGAPLFSLAGVPFPSDAQYVVLGLLAASLGLTLAPITVVISGAIRSRLRATVRFSGLTICIALVLSGVALLVATNGRLGEHAPGWIPTPALVSLAALFLWVGVASYASRGPSSIERAIFWLGLMTGVSCLLPLTASVVMFYFVKDFVSTNTTILPFLIGDLVLWVSLPIWLTVVVIGLSEMPKVRKAKPAGQ